MSGCSAFGCTNRFERKIPGITYHKFPKDKTRSRAWTIATKRKDFTPTKFTRICSEHFAEECFDRSKKYVRLKPNAVPTIFKNLPKSMQNISTMAPLTDFISEDVDIKEEVEDEDYSLEANVDGNQDYNADENVENIDENLDSLSESPSSEEESSSEDEPPETDVVYVSEENYDGNMPSSKPPRVVKVIPNGGSADMYPKEPRLDQDIKDALSVYTKFRDNTSLEEFRGANISLVVVQPSDREDEVSIFLNEEGKLKTEEELLTLYEEQKREVKALRQRTFRYEEKIKKLEKIIDNFTNYKSSAEEAGEPSDEDITEDTIYKELLKQQKKENAIADSDAEDSNFDSEEEIENCILGIDASEEESIDDPTIES